MTYNNENQLSVEMTVEHDTMALVTTLVPGSETPTEELRVR